MSSIIEDLKNEQESTTEEVKRLRLEFRSFFDAEKSKSLQLLEALRENKNDTDDIMVSSSSDTSSSSKSSGSSMFSGIFDSLGKKILAGIAGAGIAAIVAGAVKLALTDAMNDFLARMRAGGQNPETSGGFKDLDIDEGFFARPGGLLAKRYLPPLMKGSTAMLNQYKAYDASLKAQLKNPLQPAFSPSGMILDAQGKPIGGGVSRAIIPEGQGPLTKKASMARTVARFLAPLGAAAGKNALKALPVVGTGVGLMLAGDKFSEGDVTGGIFQIVSSFPGVGLGASMSAATVGAIRDTYVQQYGTVPEKDYFVDRKQTAKRIIEITKEVGRQLVPDFSGAMTDNGIRRSGFSQFGSVSAGIKKNSDDVKAAKLAARQKDLDLNTQGNGLPSDAMIAPVNINVQGGGNGGGNGGGGNPPMQNPTEPTGSAFLDSQNSALSSPLMMYGR